MKANPQLSSLAQLIEPSQMYFYLDTGASFVKLIIRRVQGLVLILDQHEFLLDQSRDVSGFVVLKDQRGILFLQGYLKEPTQLEEKFDIAELHTREESYQIKNRRNFFRYIPNIGIATEIQIGHDVHHVKINNYSAGGLLLESSIKLSTDLIYSVDTQLEIFPGEKLFANAKLVYQFNEQNTALQYGAYFLNFFSSIKNKTLKMNDVQNRIIREVNRQLLLIKKIK